MKLSSDGALAQIWFVCREMPDLKYPDYMMNSLKFVVCGLDKKNPCFYTGNKKRERETGIEPATPSLARRCSTAEPLAQMYKILHDLCHESG